MRVECFTDAESLVPYRSVWNALAGDVPFRRYDWLMPWWHAYGEANELYVLGVFVEEKLIGLAPWFREVGTASGRTLRFLGDGDACTDYLDVLAAPDDMKRVAPLLVDWLQEALTTSLAWETMEWDNLEANTPVASEVANRLGHCQAIINKRPALSCWRLELPETWYDFEMTQSKSHRKQIRRLINRVLDTERCQLHVCDDPTKIDAALEILIDLHTRRRRMLDQNGCFASDRFASFLREAGHEMMADGHCEVLWLELDNKPIAAEIHFPSDTTVYAYQAGIDPDRMDEEPGSLMQIAMIRRAIEQGKQAVDFLRGDEPYKAHWRAEPRKCETIRIVPNTTFGLIRHGIWTTKTQVKNWFKASLGNI
ncbi:GNAT family N-acetyltransferase [Bremerella cremea]|uniref:GNAT family N-acetyltransferase n=1 Tax=Bremerella cremea TaxID=1031537 RepID=A0A368KXF2_9BACT|nr:GNAT family N-acetyltransferase [Bremerella cremea]RCS53059.1 GNAT family N-acetyltransferase [Bremerella cremea]